MPQGSCPVRRGTDRGRAQRISSAQRASAAGCRTAGSDRRRKARRCVRISTVRSASRLVSSGGCGGSMTAVSAGTSRRTRRRSCKRRAGMRLRVRRAKAPRRRGCAPPSRTAAPVRPLCPCRRSRRLKTGPCTPRRRAQNTAPNRPRLRRCGQNRLSRRF